MYILDRVECLKAGKSYRNKQKIKILILIII